MDAAVGVERMGLSSSSRYGACINPGPFDTEEDATSVYNDVIKFFYGDFIQK
jgi:hypothetical protein